MKKIAIAYKGVFNFRKVSQGIVDESLLYDIKNNIDNHHTKMFKFFDRKNNRPAYMGSRWR